MCILIVKKNTKAGDQRIRPAGPVNVGRAPPRSADEVDFVDKDTPGMFLAEKNDPRNGEL